MCGDLWRVGALDQLLHRVLQLVKLNGGIWVLGICRGNFLAVVLVNEVNDDENEEDDE